MKKMVIVGWGVMSGDEQCAFCGKNASCYVDSDKAGVSDPDLMPMAPACNECTRGAEDKIAEAFSQIFPNSK